MPVLRNPPARARRRAHCTLYTRPRVPCGWLQPPRLSGRAAWCRPAGTPGAVNSWPTASRSASNGRAYKKKSLFGQKPPAGQPFPSQLRRARSLPPVGPGRGGRAEGLAAAPWRRPPATAAAPSAAPGPAPASPSRLKIGGESRGSGLRSHRAPHDSLIRKRRRVFQSGSLFVSGNGQHMWGICRSEPGVYIAQVFAWARFCAI